MMGQWLAAIQQLLMMIWFFLTDKPAAEAVMEEKDTEERRSRIPAARAELIKRRWERSKARAMRQQQKAV
jgi:hypothetical protein